MLNNKINKLLHIVFPSLVISTSTMLYDVYIVLQNKEMKLTPALKHAVHYVFCLIHIVSLDGFGFVQHLISEK